MARGRRPYKVRPEHQAAIRVAARLPLPERMERFLDIACEADCDVNHVRRLAREMRTGARA